MRALAFMGRWGGGESMRVYLLKLHYIAVWFVAWTLALLFQIHPPAFVLSIGVTSALLGP